MAGYSSFDKYAYFIAYVEAIPFAWGEASWLLALVVALLVIVALPVIVLSSCCPVISCLPCFVISIQQSREIRPRICQLPSYGYCNPVDVPVQGERPAKSSEFADWASANPWTQIKQSPELGFNALTEDWAQLRITCSSRLLTWCDRGEIKMRWQRTTQPPFLKNRARLLTFHETYNYV